MTCPGPDCARQATQAGYCSGHYAQLRRGQTLRALRTQPVQTAQVSFRIPAELRSQVIRDAKRLGISVTDWWIRSARATLR